MKAVIYARVSSTDESQSYDRQIHDLTKWADYLGLKIDKIFAEKISGFKKGLEDRIQFNMMIEYINNNIIKHILVSELSRLSRRYIDTVNFINDCTKKGIAIHIHKEGLSTLNKEGNENSIVQMLTGMLSSMAQQESISLSHRIKSGKQYSASKGGGFNQKIYGYDKGEDGRPKINEEQAILVRKMFEMLLEGTGVRTITNYLNQNYETKDWKSASVHSIVRNSFYCGKRKYKEMTLEVPAMVSEEVFNEAQEFINKRKRFVGRVGEHINPFASFIKCQCGATMNQIILKSNNTDLYKCANRCGVKSVNRPFLIREVKIVLEKNASMTKDKVVRERLNSTIETNNLNIKVNQKRIKVIKTMSDKNYERLLNGKVKENKYNEFEHKFEAELAKLNIHIKELKKTNIALKNSLKGELLHYSDNLSIFKSQVLKSIEWIEIKNEIAVIKIKGWAKVIIVIYRESQLYLYNIYLKKNGNTIGFTTNVWDKLPESNFSENVETE